MLKNERFNNILREVEVKFGRGSSKDWINRDFEDLSFQIKLSTKFNISTLTLKRIFGKIKTPDDYLPQKATLQALEIYSGMTLKTQKSTPTTVLSAPINDEKDKPAKPTKKIHPVLLILTSILLVSLVYWFFNYNTTEKGSLKLIKTEGENPKTAFFEYSTPNATDSFKILFDEEYPAVFVPNGNAAKISYYFQYPGLFRVRMQYKNTIVSDTISVFVPSNGWQASACYFEQKYNERYFPVNIKKCCFTGIFHPTKQILSSTSLDTTKIVVLRVDNFQETDKDGDSFTLETTLKNPEQWPGIRCNSIYLYVQGTKGTIRFRFANPGCSYWIDYVLSEKYLSNKSKDLSSFTFNLNVWQYFRLENRNKKVNLFINNKRIFSDNYQKSIGKIAGVTILFHGNGYIKNYILKGIDGTDLFRFVP